MPAQAADSAVQLTTGTRRLLPKSLVNFGRRYLMRHPWQTILMMVGIMLGVSVVVAIDLANASASRAFDLSTDMVVGKATHQIIGGPTGIEERIYTNLRRQGVQAASAPVVSDIASSPALGGRALQLLGVDPFAEAPFRSYLPTDGGMMGSAGNGLLPLLTTPGGILISTTLADRYGVETGTRISLTVAGQERQAIIVGLLEPTDASSSRALEGIILSDLATAQELTGRLGVLDRIDLILPEENRALAASVSSMLPQGTQLMEIASRSGTMAQMTAAFRTNLTALSLLALLVGVFLIYNSMTFSVVQRRGLFGTLRALGVTRSELFTLVIVEALLAGVIGTAAGLLLGTILGQGAVQLVSQTINDLYFVLTVRDVAVPISSLLKGGLLGVIATALAAAPPAWEAASVPPRVAMSRSGLEDKASAVVLKAAQAGVLLTIAGLAALLIPTDSLLISFAGTFAAIIGFAMVTPRLTALMMRAILPLSSRLMGALGRMAPRNVIRSLSRTSVAVAALMIAVSVTIGVSLMIGSFRNTVEVWLAQSVRGDVYVSPPTAGGSGTSGIIDPEVLRQLESWPGVSRVDSFRSVQVESSDGPLVLSNVFNPTIGTERVYQWVSVDPERVWEEMVNGAVLVSEPLANRQGISRRQASVIISTPQGDIEFPVVGVYYDYSSSQGTALMARSLYRSYWDDDSIGAAALRLEPGVNADELSRELGDRLSAIQPLLVRPNAGLRADALAIFDRTFAITGAMQLLTTLVAFVGVFSALLSLQMDKRRDFGILRAVGLTIRQLWQMVLLESGLLGAAAGIIAMPVGLVLALILIFIINRRAFGWTLQLHMEFWPFAQGMLVAILAAVIAGIIPTWQLSRKAAAEAMRNE